MVTGSTLPPTLPSRRPRFSKQSFELKIKGVLIPESAVELVIGYCKGRIILIGVEKFAI